MALNEFVRADVVHQQGLDGGGVGVAVIDTGVTAVTALRGRVEPGIDLAGAGTTEDAHGHGTAMAGIVAGGLIGNRPVGVAPGAHVVTVRVAGPGGATDVSNLLAALQWTVSFADELSIRVVTMPFGTDATTDPGSDVLAHAVERTWRSGLVVVLSAGNRGPQRATVPRPADVARVLSVGAADTRGTVDPSDDRIASFSSRGPVGDGAVAKPDVLAPGVDAVSLRVARSFVDRTFPNSAIDHQRIRASSSSFAAGAVAGAAALLIAAHPDWTPDQVRDALLTTAARRPLGEGVAVGRGVIDVGSAVESTPSVTDGSAPRRVRPADLGPIGASRGSLRIAIGPGDAPTLLHARSDLTAQGRTFDVAAYVEAPWTDRSWGSSQWTGHDWAVPRWHDRAHDQEWYGVAWG